MSESINNSDITAMATSDAVNTTSDTPPPTTTAQEPTTTPAEPTSDPPVTPPEPTTTRKPSEPTTKPDTSKSPNQPTSAAETSKSTSKKATTIMTSTPVEVVTVYTSGNAVYTSTSTSFREYATVSEVSMEEGSSGSNSGAIAGGVVGGVAFIAFLALAAFCIIKRKKNKRYDTDDMDENLSQPPMNAHPFNDYNAYGSAAMASNDSHSVLGHNRTMSQNTVPIQAVKPRPFVQAYNPGLEDSTMGSQYTGAYEQPQPNYPMNPQEEQYYHDYHQQPYQTQYMTNDYNNYQPDNNYYNSAASDIMTSAPSSHTGPITGNMNVRNVPDEVDYKPDEIPSHSAYRTN